MYSHPGRVADRGRAAAGQGPTALSAHRRESGLAPRTWLPRQP